MITEMRELPDRWILPLRGSSVTAIEFSDNVVFLLDSDVQILVGYDAYFTKGPVRAPTVELLTLRQHGQDEIRNTINAHILSSVGFKNGALRIVFDNGWHLNRSANRPADPAMVLAGNTTMWSGKSVK